MKKGLLYLLLPALCYGIAGCSDDDKNDSEISITLNESYSVVASKILTITPQVATADVSYQWILTKNPVNAVKDSLLSTDASLAFIALQDGVYDITLKVIKGNESGSKDFIVNVTGETSQYSPYITAMYDFAPAPGTLANDCYKQDGYTKEDVMKIALGRIDNTSVGYLLDLGSFGGSVVVGFDHTVINIPGERDFRVYGVNESVPNFVTAPGLLFVAYDKNGNGKPDDDEWYEIKGSAHKDNIVDSNFSVTYHRPAKDKAPVQVGPFDPFQDRESVLTENSLGESFYLSLLRNRKDLCPSWIDQDKFTFTGKRFNINIKPQVAGQYTLWQYDILDWGYANAKDPDIDIDWAIDKDGNKVHLPGIDYIKVVNCISSDDIVRYSSLQTTASTKFAGAADLHILEKYNLRKSEK
ncbi:hypothetical protein E2605_02715 [Dysgonomonas capnocytophagoides]|uniref:Bacteroidetes PKD-like domain-containing protein n=1 Tax=Dysgonomonas capnocytophagoides TaxID=45254 RepID=A0A4Y8LET3_9BACT|nr:hypothetical protein [Dysgonomonas capnocytophagoides]TFD99016.1 hypothetical protein E2605_02715 [Dysgonomonas capnocytophagoides]